jgi:Type II secretion system (T2SS), protein E, N-terminal domain
VSLRSRLPRLGDGRDRTPADLPESGSSGVPDELTPHTERKGEMSSFESSGFPSPLPPEGADPAVPEPITPLAPLQPFDEMQPLQPEAVATPPLEPPAPLQPLNAAPTEQVQQPESLQFQGVQPGPLQPLQSLEPLQPTMPPLPLLTGAEPAAEAQAVAPAVKSPEEIANLGVPLGTLIFRAGLLTEEQLEDALQEGVRTGKRLGEVLVESGLLGERDLGRLLADQKGLRFVELGSMSPDRAAIALLTAEKAHMFAALPIGFEDGIPLVAVADPSNELVTENLRRALGQDPRLVVASRSDLHAAIDRLHGTEAEAQVETAPVAEPAAPAEPAAAPQPPAVEPVALEPVALEPVAVEPLVGEPVALVAPEAPQPEPVAVEPLLPVVEPVESVPAPIEPAPTPVEAEAEPAQPESNGYTTVAPAAVPSEPTPEPVVEQTPLAEPVAQQAPEPEPEPEAAPVELQPVPVAPVLAPVVAEVVEEPTFSHVEEEQAAPVQSAGQELPSALSYDVSLRLSDGERVPIGSFGEPEKAREYARDVVKHLADESEGWPFFSGRFMRPDTILSVDIVPVGEPDRWLGSSIRSNWASRLNR